MKDLKLVMRETGDKTPGMENSVHVDFDNGEPCLPYVERELAEAMVRRWNTHEELLETLRGIVDLADQAAEDLEKDADKWGWASDLEVDAVESRANVNKAKEFLKSTQP